jgi:hypothetical protein
MAKGDAEAEDLALSIGADAEGDEDGAVENAPGLTDLFVAGVDDDVGEGAQRAWAPVFEIRIEPGGALADVGGADRSAAEFLQNGGHFASGHALHIHLGERKRESLLAASAPLQGSGIKVEIPADLGHGKSDRTEAGLEGLWLETIGVALARLGALERARV